MEIPGGPSGENNEIYTVMSYNAYNGLHAITPMIHDIAAIQKLYGKSTKANGGKTDSATNNTTWTFTSASNPFIAAAAMGSYNNPGTVLMTLWDPTGDKDKIVASDMATPVLIDLREGEFGAIGTEGYAKNVGIAWDAVIEDAIGGFGNDILTGNYVVNSLGYPGCMDHHLATFNPRAPDSGSKSASAVAKVKPASIACAAISRSKCFIVKPWRPRVYIKFPARRAAPGPNGSTGYRAINAATRSRSALRLKARKIPCSSSATACTGIITSRILNQKSLSMVAGLRRR